MMLLDTSFSGFTNLWIESVNLNLCYGLVLHLSLTVYNWKNRIEQGLFHCTMSYAIQQDSVNYNKKTSERERHQECRGHELRWSFIVVFGGQRGSHSGIQASCPITIGWGNGCWHWCCRSRRAIRRWPCWRLSCPSSSAAHNKIHDFIYVCLTSIKYIASWRHSQQSHTNFSVFKLIVFLIAAHFLTYCLWVSYKQFRCFLKLSYK